MTLALCALGTAAIYALLARALIARASYTVLAQSHAVLAVGFATLAVPLALSARATGAVFALEGAGFGVAGVAPEALVAAGDRCAAAARRRIRIRGGRRPLARDQRFLLNPTAIGALLLAVAGFAAAWSYQRRQRHDIATAYYLWGLLWWLGGLVHEIGRFFQHSAQADAVLVLAAVTAADLGGATPHAGTCAGRDRVGDAGRRLPAGPAAERCPPAALCRLWRIGVGGVRRARRAQPAVPAPGSGGVARIAQFLWWLLWPSLLSLLACGVAATRTGAGLDGIAGHVAVAAAGGAVAVALERAALAAGCCV